MAAFFQKLVGGCGRGGLCSEPVANIEMQAIRVKQKGGLSTSFLQDFERFCTDRGIRIPMNRDRLHDLPDMS